MSKFTPGPWIVDRVDFSCFTEEDGEACAHVASAKDITASAANANLIAAAPDMYTGGKEALAALYGAREALGDIANISYAIELLEQALAKADGES